MADKKNSDVQRAPHEVAMEQIENRFQYLLKKDIRRGKVNYSDLDTNELLGEEMIPDFESPAVEDIIEASLMKERLHHCIALLTSQERALIFALFFQEKSETELSEEMGISQQLINYRKKKILQKLKKMI